MASDRLWRNRNIKLVILDTSAIFMCFEYSIDMDGQILDLIGKCQITVPKPIYDEINILSIHGKGAKKNKAKSALKLIKKYKIISTDEMVYGDDAILHYSKKLSAYVVTNDKALRKILKNESIPVIYLRGKQKLFLE
jgi:rRNA-processing protein FCF1